MTVPNNASQFSAIDPALGYLYQVRSALLWSLQRLKSGSEFLVSVEAIDDVAFQNIGGDSATLLQTKHHRSSKASLSDASPDLWKTLRIWFEGDPLEPIQAETELILVTTSTAPDGSAAAFLRSSARNVEKAAERLRSAALSSGNQELKKAYQAFLKASTARQIDVLRRVVIIDAAPTIADLDPLLATEIYWAAGREHHSAFLERLEGWWLRRVLRQLNDLSTERIGSPEIEEKMTELREQFKRESLPVDEDLVLLTLDDATASAHSGDIFVRQLEIINIGRQRIAAAIRDYYKAFEQRSRWARDGLVDGVELGKYERRLIEEWEATFYAIHDEINAETTEEEKMKAARSVLTWAVQASLPIRSGVTEPFISRGSFHMLADGLRVGWHPEFETRLQAVLTGSGESS